MSGYVKGLYHSNCFPMLQFLWMTLCAQFTLIHVAKEELIMLYVV